MKKLYETPSIRTKDMIVAESMLLGMSDTEPTIHGGGSNENGPKVAESNGRRGSWGNLWDEEE